MIEEINKIEMRYKIKFGENFKEITNENASILLDEFDNYFKKYCGENNLDFEKEKYENPDYFWMVSLCKKLLKL